MARRDGAGARLLTRNGHDWSPRYPAIVQAVTRSRCVVPDRRRWTEGLSASADAAPARRSSTVSLGPNHLGQRCIVAADKIGQCR
jgi:hypothetical protein